MYMEHKKLFVLFGRITAFSYMNKLDVINNLCWKRDDWVTVTYDIEWYLGVAVEVG